MSVISGGHPLDIVVIIKPDDSPEGIFLSTFVRGDFGDWLVEDNYYVFMITDEDISEDKLHDRCAELGRSITRLGLADPHKINNDTTSAVIRLLLKDLLRDLGTLWHRDQLKKRGVR